MSQDWKALIGANCTSAIVHIAKNARERARSRYQPLPSERVYARARGEKGKINLKKGEGANAASG